MRLCDACASTLFQVGPSVKGGLNSVDMLNGKSKSGKA